LIYLLINIQLVATDLDMFSTELAFIQCLIKPEKYRVMLNFFSLRLKRLRNNHEMNN